MKRINSSGNSISFMMVMFLAILPLLFSSLTQVQLDDFKLPVIVTKEKRTPSCLTPFYMMNAWYDLERLEKLGDTLYLDKKPDRKAMDANYYEFYENPSKGKPAEFSDAGLMVVVDTVHEITMVKQPIWANYLFHRSFDKNRKVRQDDTLTQLVKSFPVYIINTSSNKTAVLRTQDGSAIMIAEAKDKHNKWQPIEYWSNSWCGNSYFSLSIAPGYFTFTRGIKCSGDTKRLCRLKLSNNKTILYSNEFYMGISESQFNKPNGAE